MTVVLKEGNCDASQVLERLPDPPSYSAVRALLKIMVDKGYLLSHTKGKKLIYRSAVESEKEKKTILKKVVNNFFEGSAPQAISTILKFSSTDLSQQDYEELKRIIEEAENKRP